MKAISNFVYDSTSKYLFNRAYSVSIGPTGQASAFNYGNVSFNGGKPAPLRIRFDIDKNTIGSNTAKIEIFNLNRVSQQIFKKGYSIQLAAGYQQLIQTIFIGNIHNATTKRDGPDIISQFDLIDGGLAITRAVFDRSYPEGSTLTQILQDIAKAMGLNAGVVLGIPQKIYNNGFSTTGTCADALTKLTRGQNLEWSVQNESLNIIPLGVVSSGATAELISSTTGMIGVPSNNEQGFTQFTSLLNSKLVPQSFVQLSCENTDINGFYKLRRCHYEGDSHDNKWQVACEAVRIQAQIAGTLPAAQGFNYDTAAVV